MTRGERAPLVPASLPAGQGPAPGPACAEAQADGVPCDDVHADCECCSRALALEAPQGGPERPR
jgi:hypothetical protein